MDVWATAVSASSHPAAMGIKGTIRNPDMFTPWGTSFSLSPNDPMASISGRSAEQLAQRGCSLRMGFRNRDARAPGGTGLARGDIQRRGAGTILGLECGT